MLYPELLACVHGAVAAHFGIAPDADAAAAFGRSIEHWPPFPDSAEALAYLKRHYRLVVLSNVDRASFAHSARRLGVAFDAVYTAQDIGSYKPDPRNFEYMLARRTVGPWRHPSRRGRGAPGLPLRDARRDGRRPPGGAGSLGLKLLVGGRPCPCAS